MVKYQEYMARSFPDLEHERAGIGYPCAFFDHDVDHNIQPSMGGRSPGEPCRVPWGAMRKLGPVGSRVANRVP